MLHKLYAFGEYLNVPLGFQVRDIMCNAAAHFPNIVNIPRTEALNEGRVETLLVNSDEENEDDDFEAAEAEEDDVDLEDGAVKVEVRFNVAIMSDVVEKGDPFFLILCDKALFVNAETFTDDWGNEWPGREMLIRGFYYERVSVYQRGHTVMYRLIKEKEAYAASDHVICSNFAILLAYTWKGLQRYGMSLETREKLMNALDCKNITAP
jgi:hypothetical protein